MDDEKDLENITFDLENGYIFFLFFLKKKFSEIEKIKKNSSNLSKEEKLEIIMNESPGKIFRKKVFF